MLRNELLSNAKALLHPISFDEPFGLSIIESMMCGTPVIAFNRGSMAEIILEGHSGFLVNNISEAVKAIEKLDQVDSRTCRDYATRKFGVGRMIDEYINVYAQILNNR